MIAIIDYGIGNVQAFLNIYKRLNIAAIPASTPADIEAADKLILPGVGAFDWAMEKFNRSGLRDAVGKAALEQQVPLLGICIGMHMLARSSEEGEMQGLGWTGGDVKRFSDGKGLPLPHMGWNDVALAGERPLLTGLETTARFYFLHSYYFLPDDDEEVLATTNYGGPFASAISKGNVFGVQFHPEKSHGFGSRLLQNFAGL